MQQFMGDIAAMLEIALIGAGLIVLHFAHKDGAKLLKSAAYIMLVGGILGLLCTTYYWFKYYQAGVFDVPIS